MYSLTRTLRSRSAAQLLPLRALPLARSYAAGAHPDSLSQGHPATKSQNPLHKDADVQSAAERATFDARSKPDEPGFDTATQGGTGGAVKADKEGAGPFADHRGGQESANPGGKAGQETAAGGSIGDSVKKMLGRGGKEMPAEKKSFHTSARASSPSTPAMPSSTPKDDASGSRKPAESSLPGEQNTHLKHKDAGAQDSGKGNAAPNPSLPSKQSGAKGFHSAAFPGQSRSFSTTMRALANESDPLKTDPHKDDPPTGAAPPAEEGPSQAEKAGDKPAKEEKKPGLPEKEKSKAEKGMRKFSTSARAGATKSPAGYTKAMEGEPNEAGYDAPPEALPAKLDSAYDESIFDPPPPGTKPSSEVQFSSTARDPPNAALAQAAKDGTLAERNGQPEAAYGKIGIDEAWKHRQHQ